MSEFIIVDSVKGGCGKTSEALAAAIRNSLKLYEEAQKKGVEYLEELSRNGKRSEVCIIDLDLLGTSIEYMLTTDSFVGKDGDKYIVKGSEAGLKKNADIYLNNLVEDSANFNKCYISSFMAKTSKGDANFDLIASSPYDKERRQFKISNNSNYMMRITPTHFRGTLKKLIGKLAKEYKIIIFDMPPNSDPYTDTVFDILLNISERSENEYIKKVTLEIISTYDRAHINANAEWLGEFYSGIDGRWRMFDEIKFILNDTMNVKKNFAKDVFPSIREVINNKISENPCKWEMCCKEYDGDFALRFSVNEDTKKSILDFYDTDKTSRFDLESVPEV